MFVNDALKKWFSETLLLGTHNICFNETVLLSTLNIYVTFSATLGLVEVRRQQQKTRL